MPTSYHKRQTPITKRMAEDMLVRNLAPRTIDSYTYHVDRFARHFGKLPEDLGPEQIREFQLWLIHVNEASWSQFNQKNRTSYRLASELRREPAGTYFACQSSGVRPKRQHAERFRGAILAVATDRP